MLELFITFFKIGSFTVGGGYAMIPLIEEQVVNRKHWVEQEELTDLIAVAQSCPGIFAVNLSIFIGYKLYRTPGAVVCTLGTALPSFIIILLIALFFQRFRDYAIVNSMFRGIRPAVVALIAAPVFRMAQTARIRWSNAWIPAVSAIAIWLLGVSPVYVILFAGIGGYTYGQLLK
jgi:chromate transporter